jgi:hypothetical protein
MAKSMRTIVGISLPPTIAMKFKEEAVRRNIPLRELFLELWAKYEKSKAGKASS